MSRESKSQLVDRWRRENREDEASRFRETIRQGCRDAGMTRKESNETAWRQAAAAFPPLPVPAMAACPASSPEGTEQQPAHSWDAAGECSTWESLQWAVDALGEHEEGLTVDTAGAPSMAAWSLFCWGRKAPEKLYSLWVNLSLDRDGDGDGGQKTRQQVGEIEQMLTELLDDELVQLMRDVDGGSGSRAAKQ